MRKLVITITILVATALALYLYRPNNQHESVHYHAGFIVYIDGVKQDFSEAKYMNFTPCSEHEAKLTPSEEQMEKAHLHEMVGDVVHVHREGGTWGDLFQNIRYTPPAGKQIVGYMEGQKIDNILSKPIIANQSIIIAVGEPTGANLESYVSLEHIKEVESQSELCGS